MIAAPRALPLSAQALRSGCSLGSFRGIGRPDFRARRDAFTTGRARTREV